MSLSFGLIIFAMICGAGAGCLMLGIMLAFSFYDHFTARVRRSFHQLVPPPVRPADTPSQNPGSSTAAIAWSLLPSTAVMAIFVGFSGAGNREWDRIATMNQSPPPPIVVNSIKPTIVQNVSLPNKSDELSVTLPAWIENGDLTEGDVQRVVLSSRLWSTEAEAIHDLQNQIIELIRGDFQRRHPGFLEPKGFKVDRVIESMIKERYIKQVEQDFGTFTAPMYRAWWQVEISPLVRTELYPEWKSASVQNRIIVIGVVFSLITLVASSVELFARLKRDTQRSTIHRLAVCAFPVLLWTAVELLFAVRLMS